MIDHRHSTFVRAARRCLMALAIVSIAWGCGEDAPTETCEQSCQRRANDAYNSCLQMGQSDANAARREKPPSVSAMSNVAAWQLKAEHLEWVA